MYLPSHFAETDRDEIRRIVAAYPLAILVAGTQGALTANHIPMLADGDDRLIGHVAANNELHGEIGDGAEVMAIFRAAEAYVSPNWYPTKQQHHRHVPTWNYQAIHIYGTIAFQRERKAKAAIVGKLTKHFEAIASTDRPWRMADAPRDYMDAMLDSIVGFEIAIARTVAKSKLSQNREPIDAENAARELNARGESELADAMTARLAKR